jgi:hypothetical protein
MSSDEILAELALDAHEWRGVQQLSNAVDALEPLAKRGNLGKIVADRLVALGLAECGPVIERYRTTDSEQGYRLNDLGWKVLERGRYPKRG